MKKWIKSFTVQKMVILAMLVAMNVVLARFLSINAWNIRIGFSFITIATAAVFYGPADAAIVGGLGDLLGSLLFPSGPYFPGFTLTAVLTGIVYGVLLYKKVTIPRTLIAVGIVQFVLGMLLNTLWISVLYGKGYLAVLPTRVAQAALLFIVQSVVIFAMNGLLLKRIKPILEGGS